MSSNEKPELLFFDTFSHAPSEELNLDLVQFPKSVHVREIRIIPLGARVEGDFPGGVRLGATNPTKFHIDFFVNDLSKPGASTFESLGSLDYCQNGQIHMECGAGEEDRIPTDGLVLRGWYTTITLAVYGNLTQVVTDVKPPVCSNPVQPQPLEVPTVKEEPLPTQEWSAEANPIPTTYTGNVAVTNPETYGPNYPENYDSTLYRAEYYDNNAPKDPRMYPAEEWGNRRVSAEREQDRRSPRSIDDRERKSRRRSRSRSSRHVLRSRSRSRDYIIKGEYRPLSRSRSRSIGPRDRIRTISGDQDWDRGSYKKDDYRRHREGSYDRSRVGSYDKRSGSYDRRSRSYGKRSPSYDRKLYDKRSGSYERRATSYERKRLSPFKRRSSYSRSPSRDDPRKRPRSPPGERRSPREGKSSPINSIRSDDGEFSGGKQIPRVEFYHASYRHKTSIRSPSQEPETAPFIDAPHPSLVTVQIVDNTSTAKAPESPVHNPEDEKSVDAEQFEPILSDEDICDDLEAPYMEVDYDVNDYEGVEDIIKYYNPFKSEWVQYENKNKIQYVSPRKGDVKDVMNATFDELCDVSTDLFKISEITQTAKGREQKFIASTFKEIDNICREEWVHQCEQIFVSLTNLCKQSDIILRIFQDNHKDDEFKDILDLLVTFCRIGLNYDFALVQQQPTYKIRHMKCGIRLVEALLSHRHSEQVIKMLLNSGLDVSMTLLEMYSKDYMALSIRLMILKSLNACLSSKTAIDHFMKEAVYPKFDKNDNENKLKNGYQALITMMKMNPLGRIKFSVSALIKKLNMYELLGKMNETIQNFNKKVAENPESDDHEFSEKDTEFLVDGIEEIICMYQSQCFHLSQPKRFLPVSAQFEINKDCSNETLLQFFKIHNLLEVCLYVLTCPSTCNNLVIISPVYDLIYELIHSENGINFLYRNMDMSELLFKTLMQPYGQQIIDEFVYPHDLSTYSDLQVLGLELAYRLKCLYYLHSICDIQAGDTNDNELIDRLQSLYCLSFGCIGKVAVPDIIVMGDHAEYLIEVFEKTLKSKSKNDSPTKQKSPAKGYAVELIASAVRFSANVPFMKKYAARLVSVTKEHDKFEPSVSSVLQEMIPFLKPVENASILSGEDMAECMEIIKTNLEHAPDLPGELSTCLRVLRHYCISDYHATTSIANESSTDEYVELKYKYNVLQLFSLDGVAHLSSILDRLSVRFEQPSVHSSFFASIKGLQLAQMMLPCVRLLDEMLARVVKSRGSRFRDLTAAPILLKANGIAKAFPIGCVGYRTASKAAEATVRALLAYCQPIADDASDKDSIRRGPWTTLSSEVISYIMTAPYTFVSGLLVFSELLPLPLPMQTKIPPTKQELSDALNERRMWSAHLHALSNDLIDMIQVICMSTYRPVVHMLRRVCVQIADLAPNTAATVAKAAIGAVIRELKENEPASASAARVLSFLACLLEHAPVKCAVLHALNTGEAKANDIQTALCTVLSSSHATNEHNSAQEFASHALAGLCDAEVTLTSHNESPDMIVANSLPNPESLACLLDSSIDCLSSDTKTATVTSSILRAYFVLTEHEYGFQQFRKVLPKRRDSFGKFFKWLLESSGDEKAECLSLYIDLIRILKVEEGEGPVGRKSTLSVSEMADMVGFTHGDSEHPVLTLENILKARSLDESLTNASFLTSQLSNFTPSSPTSPPPPTSLHPPSPISAQFSGRTVSSGGDVSDERLTSGYWLSIPVGDEEVNEGDLVLCDVSSVGGLLGAQGTPWPSANTNTHKLSLSRSRSESADAFRSRPPNTSRPPSLHVDDFTRARTVYPQQGHARGGRRGMLTPDRGRFAAHHYRQLRGRGAWEPHFGHFGPAQPYVMGGMVWGAGRMQRPRHRTFMR